MSGYLKESVARPPRDYRDLNPGDVLEPADIVAVTSDLAYLLGWVRPDLTGWYRALALALFERFGLDHLPLRAAVADATKEGDILSAQAVVPNPDHLPALARVSRVREGLLALPFEEDPYEPQPFLLAKHGPKLGPPLESLERKLARRLRDHSEAAKALTRELDRLLIALWGCPPERLDDQVTVEQLIAAGLTFQFFDS
jgi:hypothetical protein